MKTAVRPETVKFGTVTQCGRHWAFVRTDTGAEVRLHWSHLRWVETLNGGILFSTGQSPMVRRGDVVAFVPQEGLWLWALKAEYEGGLAMLDQEPHLVTPLPSPPPAPEINLEQEMAALGSAQLQKWQRRYGNPRAFV